MAQPPKTTTDDAAHQIARIDRLTDAGRVNWFGLMAYLVFVFITMLGVEDADFFIPSRQTQLPLVNVAIPTDAFFVFAPILGAALYVYLHLTVRKATAALAAAPALVDGTPLERHLKPWLLNDLVLRWRGDGAIDPRPLNVFTFTTVVLLIWVAGPVVLLGMWVRTWPAHDLYMTSIAGLCFALVLYVGHVSWVRLRRDLRGISAIYVPRTDIPRYAILVLLTGGMLWLGHIKTESGAPWGTPGRAAPNMIGNVTGFFASLSNLADSAWWGALTPAVLADVQFSVLPPDQADPVAARQRYRAGWCGRLGIPPDICGSLPAPGAEPDAALWSRRGPWCQEIGISAGDPNACRDWFAARDTEFRIEWTEYRGAVIATLPKPDLRRTDLRGANLSGASLTGVVLREARLNGANLLRAELQGANLHSADMQGINLGEAQMQGADLRFADLRGAFLSNARLREAKFFDTNMQDARLRGAHLEGTDLRGQQMQRADLSHAHLAGADLREAQLHGATLAMAKLHGANLRDAHLDGADLFRARLDGVDLGGAQLAGADLRQARMQGARLREARMHGADLRGAQLEGADLGSAVLDGADLGTARMAKSNWNGASTRATLVPYTDLRGGVDLDQARLSQMIGNAATLLPVTPEGDADVHIPSCWAADPPGFEHLVTAQARYGLSETDLRDPARGFFCPPGEVPRKTGTPWPVDTDPPWGARVPGESDRDYRQRVAAWVAAQPPGEPID
jgi:uncharacterized protein YjbI with pentapeptide repeats